MNDVVSFYQIVFTHFLTLHVKVLLFTVLVVMLWLYCGYTVVIWGYNNCKSSNEARTRKLVMLAPFSHPLNGVSGTVVISWLYRGYTVVI